MRSVLEYGMLTWIGESQKTLRQLTNVQCCALHVIDPGLVLRSFNDLIVFINVVEIVTFHLCVNPHLRVFLVRFIPQCFHFYSRLPPQLRGNFFILLKLKC